METVYDWVTVMIFAGLATRFLSKSADPHDTDDSYWHYLLPSLGCAVANWLGNHDYTLAAIALIAGTLAYIYRFHVRQDPSAN